MSELERRTVTIWRAFLRDKCWQIGMSEAGVWHELRFNNASYEPHEHDQWVVVSSEEAFPVVRGESPDDGCHICWTCPYCGHVHDSDRGDYESPQLWYCEHGTSGDNDIALVEWVEDWS